MLIALGVMHDLKIYQMVAKKTFLNGDLEDEICMVQLKGFVVPGKEEKGCIYVTLWAQTSTQKRHAMFDQTKLTNGFKINKCDKCVHI